MYKNRIKDLVSIVVSNYNNEKYIVECLDSLINQTYKNIEIIIIDDCSTDNSVHMIESWINRRKEEDRKKIILHKLPRNTGFSGAVTSGLYLARGEYIAMQDGDDVSDIHRIETEVNYIKGHDDIKMVGTNYAVFKNYVREAKVLLNYVAFGKSNIEDIFHKGGSPVCYGTILFRGEVFDEIGGVTRKIKGAEDYEFISKSLVYGIDNINSPLYLVRAHPEQRSRIYYGNGNDEFGNKRKEKLSILLVLDKFNIGGTETHVLSIAEQLINEGLKVTVIAANGPLKDEFLKLNCKVYEVDFPAVIEKNEQNKSRLLNRITEILKAEKINVIHSHQSSSGSLAVEAGKKLNIPCVFTLHGKYYYDVLDTTLRNVDKIISVSIPVYKWVLNSNIDSEIIPNGIDFNKPIYKSNYVRDVYKIPQDSLVIVYCSRMEWGKIDVCRNLIRCIASLKKNENIKYHGIIIGDGSGYNELKRMGDMANKLLGEDVIHFTGFQRELQKYYSSSDIVLGTGRVAIEAMSCSKKVIGAGNAGYYGFITKDKFEEAWETYFGDHDSGRENNPVFLYKDMRDYYLNKSSYDEDINDIYDKSLVLFDIYKVTSKLIDIYVNLVK